jgi:Uma2 family endonuclease
MKTLQKEITDINQLDVNGLYTYADYLTWKFKERVELFKGRLMKMSPAPSFSHQDISGEIAFELKSYLRKKPCKVISAPFDVRLKNSKKPVADSEYNTVVQPDITVICDLEKIDDRGCKGSPNLVVEILSPGNSNKEMGIKFDLYEENKIPEYWIVEPANQTILVYYLKGNKYINERPLPIDAKIQSKIFPELNFELKDIFER